MVTLGLVGCGDWGKNILRDLVALQCRVQVASRSEDSRQRALALGAHGVCSAGPELPECDGYVLATPLGTLADEALKLLPRGKPIFSEKTLCPTLAVAEQLSDAGAEGRIFLMHKWEYHNGVRALRAVAESGRLGRLEQVHCRRHGWVAEGREPDVLTLLGIHDLTIVRHILGTIPEPQYALIRRQGDVPIGLTAVLGGEVKVVLSIEARHAVQSRCISLMGTEGSACLESAYEDHVRIRDARGEHLVPFESNMPLLAELSEFVAYLQGGPEPLCGFGHARLAAAVLDQLRALGSADGPGPSGMRVCSSQPPIRLVRGGD